MRILPSIFPATDDTQPAPAHPHGREAVQVHAVRQGLPAEGHPRPAHAHAPGRPALLLPHAQLPAPLRHRARGEEAHRQPHEPARGQDAARLQDAAAAAARRRGEARAVLPAVLRAALPAVRGAGGVQAGGGRRRGVPAGAVTRAAAVAAAPARARARARAAPRPLRLRPPLQLGRVLIYLSIA